MRKLFTLLALLGFITSASAALNTVKIANFDDCPRALNEELRESVARTVENGGHVFLSSLRDFVIAAKEMGIPATEFTHIDRLVDIYMAGKIKHPVLKEVLHEISTIDEENDTADVALCILRSDCKFVDPDVIGGMARVPPIAKVGEHIWLFDNFQKGDVELPHPLLFVATGNREYGFAVSFLHEMIHYLDFLFFEKWVEANLDLMDAGKKADKLFQQFAKKTERGWEISKSFWIFFTEVRAYSAQAAFFMNSTKGREAKSAYGMVLTHSREVAQTLGLRIQGVKDLGEIFEFSDGRHALKPQMEKTIAAADALR